MSRWIPALVPVLVLVLVALASCSRAGYVAQAGMGQLDLWKRARPLGEVVADPAIPARTRALLAEVPAIVEFAGARGLRSKGNYQQYVALPRAAVVWFTAAAPELSLEPVEWSFPIVGSFTYLGWFDFVRATRFREQLRRDGYDVYLRGVRAYSTGGWFRDPVLSTMLPDRDDLGHWYLANVLFHELTHANILVNDQSTYNESIASFVGDTITIEYLRRRFGADSEELAEFRQRLDREAEIGAALRSAYARLEKLYGSRASREDKLRRKKEILGAIETELGLLREPNNAMLAGYRTYNAGQDELRSLLEHCGGDWQSFFASVRRIDESSFPEEQTDDIGPIIARRLQAPCGAARTAAR